MDTSVCYGGACDSDTDASQCVLAKTVSVRGKTGTEGTWRAFAILTRRQYVFCVFPVADLCTFRVICSQFRPKKVSLIAFVHSLIVFSRTVIVIVSRTFIGYYVI